jgi:mono/diheme cytochrome c family protein
MAGGGIAMRAAVLVLASLGVAAAAAAPPPRELKGQTAPSGAWLYRSYCASCHGQDGTGGGPVAEALRMRPSDLTTLKRRNKGEFPSYRLKQMLDGSDELPAHGSKKMPVWGPGLGPQRAAALIQHLQSVQK